MFAHDWHCIAKFGAAYKKKRMPQEDALTCLQDFFLLGC